MRKRFKKLRAGLEDLGNIRGHEWNTDMGILFKKPDLEDVGSCEWDAETRAYAETFMEGINSKVVIRRIIMNGHENVRR